MKTSVISCTLVLTAAVPSLALAKTPERKTNVLIIMTDEHNLRTLGCYRDLMPKAQAEIWGEGNVVQTPNLDALAKDGLIALSCYASSPLSAPARSCFQSGLYSHHTGVSTNDLPMKRDVETFAQVFADHGYHTGYIGKWHLEGPAKPLWEPEAKFGWLDNRYMFNRGHWKKLEETASGPQVATYSPNGKPNYDVAGADEKSFTTDFLSDRAIEYMRIHKEEPFCCMLSIPDPHGPNTVRAPYDTLFRHLTFKEPYTYHERGDHDGAAWEKMEGGFDSRQMELYFGMVKCIDDNVGKIIRFLKSEGLYDHTLIIFTSDHGDMCGEHHRHDKTVPYEMSAHVPFIMHNPALFKRPTVNKTVISTVDFKPTLLGLLGLQARKPAHGRDMSAYLLGKEIPLNDDIIFMRSPNKPDAFDGTEDKEKKMYWIAAVTSRYKLIHTPNSGESPWLIDLEKDPFELHNFYQDSSYSEVISRMSAKLLEYGITSGDKLITRTKIKEELELKIKQGSKKPF